MNGETAQYAHTVIFDANYLKSLLRALSYVDTQEIVGSSAFLGQDGNPPSGSLATIGSVK